MKLRPKRHLEVLVIDKFQPGVFMDNSAAALAFPAIKRSMVPQVRTDVLEKDLANMLQKLITYLKKRKQGSIPAPEEKLEAL